MARNRANRRYSLRQGRVIIFSYLETIPEVAEEDSLLEEGQEGLDGTTGVTAWLPDQERLPGPHQPTLESRGDIREGRSLYERISNQRFYQGKITNMNWAFSNSSLLC